MFVQTNLQVQMLFGEEEISFTLWTPVTFLVAKGTCCGCLLLRALYPKCLLEFSREETSAEKLSETFTSFPIRRVSFLPSFLPQRILNDKDERRNWANSPSFT